MAKKAMFLFLAVMIGLAGAVYAGPKEAAEIVKAAEREGKVTLTSSLKDDEIKPFIKAFQKEYPKIEIVPEREHGSAETLLRELVAGAEVNDVVQVHPDIENELIDMGFLGQGNWADFNVVPQLALDQNQTIGAFLHSHAIVFNTKLMKKEEAPKTWQDMLDPKWKGKFVVDTSCNSFLRLVDAWGKEKVLDYASKIGKQKPQFVRGDTETMTLMAAGDYTLSLGTLLSAAVFTSQKGGPLAWNIPDPVPTGFIKFAMLKKGKHPNAARVFLGWLGSKGFKLMDDVNPGRSVPFGGTYTDKLFKGKTLSWTPSRKQLPDRQEFFSQMLTALGVPR
jgi:iron(III) transport system substrate-binding protein